MLKNSYSMPEAWRSWVWTGGETLLGLKDCYIHKQELKPDDVLICNKAIGLNPVDWKLLPTQMNLVPGVDGAGVVVAIGDNVDSKWLGLRVAYHQNLQRNGSFAEFTIVQSRILIRLPDDLDFMTAAAVPCPALTAWMSLEKIPVKKGLKILIAGAGGSVGSYLVQFAKTRGFDVSIISNKRHWSHLESLGATCCITDSEVTKQKYFAVIDTVGSEHAAMLSGSLEANGHLICIQGRVEQSPDTEFGRALSLHEVALGGLHLFGNDRQWLELTQQGEKIMSQIVHGTLQPELLLQFSYDQLPEQLFALQHRNFSGKQIVLI